MYLKTHLAALFLAATATVLSTSTAQSTQEPVRFSRLLSKQPDILRFSSISNLGPASSVLKQIQPTPDAPAAVAPTTRRASLAGRQFLHRAAPVDERDDGPVLITRAQPGEEYVFIQSNIKSDESESSITNINQKPSARKPLALLRQSSGNKLNISPVFPDNVQAPPSAPAKINGNDQVSILSEFEGDDGGDDTNEATTAAPLYDEYYEDGTTENTQYDDVPATTIQPVVQQQEKKGRMIINVVTSAPRIVVENNATTSAPAISSTSAPLVVKPSAKSVEENLVVDAFHRNGHFPDFEDSPAHLQPAESNQPARVNVRPASSGKDYEYEYIYYYYDDEDEDNSTKKADSSAGSAGADLQQGVQNSFESDKIAVSNLPTNSLDTADSRLPKSFVQDPVAVSSIPESPESLSDEQLQVTTLPSEILRTQRPNSVNRPVVLKQSNLAPTVAAEAPATTTTERRTIPERRTTTTTTAAPATDSPRTRLRNKSRLDAPSFNQFSRTTEEPVATEAPARRPPPKDLLRRRNPARRLQTTEAPAVEDQAEEQAVQVQEQQQQQQPVRLPPRTRFPPRQNIAPAVVETSEAAPTQAVIQETVPAQSYEPQAITPEAEKRARDNFARQKSINDLYALTRLHQLAINTRVPNRKPDPHAKGVLKQGFVNSAEQTTRFPEDSNEATTISSLHHSAEQVELTVQPTTTTTTTTTTTEASLPERPTGPGRRNRFRPRGQRVNPAPATEETVSTTQASANNRIPASPNRFGSRRRLSTTTEAPQPDNERTTEARPAVRPPARNRFSGRTRPTTSTTEASETAAAEQQRDSESQPPRRRPGFQGRRRNQQQATSQSTDETPATPASTAAPQPRKSGDSERRRFNFGNPARNRPSGPGSRSLPGRGRASTTEAPETAPEVHEPIVSEQVSVSEGEVHEEQAAVGSDKEPIVSISSTTSSSVSSDAVVSKKGSAGVLGRLRSRSKPVSTTTTVAPEVQAVERKPSRLSGILNRRKLGGSTTSAPVQEETHEEPEESQSQILENEPTQQKGVVVQISSTVTESEEIGHPEDHSSTTHASILNRIKSQRKPGQIYRKSSVSSSE